MWTEERTSMATIPAVAPASGSLPTSLACHPRGRDRPAARIRSPPRITDLPFLGNLDGSVPMTVAFDLGTVRGSKFGTLEELHEICEVCRYRRHGRGRGCVRMRRGREVP